MPENNGRNALAELAEEMKEGLDCLIMDDTVPHWIEVYGKARRIVAELANAYATYVADMVHNNICLLAYDALAKCREIAAEGAKHDSK